MKLKAAGQANFSELRLYLALIRDQRVYVTIFWDVGVLIYKKGVCVGWGVCVCGWGDVCDSKKKVDFHMPKSHETANTQKPGTSPVSRRYPIDPISYKSI